VSDDDHLVAAAGDRGTDVVGSCPWCEPLVGLGRGVERSREFAAGLAGAQKRARENRRRMRILGPEPLTESARLLTALGSEPPQLVRLSRLGLGVADEVQAHVG
jgi:hypothetical protein